MVVTFKVVAKIFVVVREFEMIIFPRTYRFARPGEVPMPILEVTQSEPAFKKLILAEVVKILGVVREFDAYMFP